VTILLNFIGATAANVIADARIALKIISIHPPKHRGLLMMTLVPGICPLGTGRDKRSKEYLTVFPPIGSAVGL
jgi:hypothetical protein